MTNEKIARINELYHKSKSNGLTEDEQKEQQLLRKEYIEAIKADMKQSFQNVSIKNPDGSITQLKKIK